MSTPRVWFLTGANSGLGLEVAKKVLSEGEKLVAAIRSPSKFPEELKGPNVHVIKFDVGANQEEINRIVEAAYNHFGRIDVVHNSAGYVQLGAVEEISDEEIKAQFEINVFGVLRTIRAVLPHLRKQDSATIINLSSTGGLTSWPVSGVYCSTKFAIEGLTVALAAEIAPFNINAILVEAGAFRTPFLSGAGAGKSTGTRIAAYEGTMGHALLDNYKSFDGKQPGDPKLAAARMWEAASGKGLFEGKKELWAGNFLRLPLGTDAGQTLRDVAKGYAKSADDMEPIWSSTDLK